MPSVSNSHTITHPGLVLQTKLDVSHIPTEKTSWAGYQHMGFGDTSLVLTSLFSKALLVKSDQHFRELCRNQSMTLTLFSSLQQNGNK